MYIEYLVVKIKELYSKKENYEWYFDQLIEMYNPLIVASTKKVYNKFKLRVSFLEIKVKILEIFFESVLRYEPKFHDNDKEVKNFTYVYFCNYLKRKLPWDLMRLYKPTKIEHDDLQIDPRHVELNLTKDNSDIQKHLEYSEKQPISDNFIQLCRLAQRQLNNDLLSDIMILHFGYGYKVKEIAAFFSISSTKVHNSLSSLKKFWKQNSELIND